MKLYSISSVALSSYIHLTGEKKIKIVRLKLVLMKVV